MQTQASHPLGEFVMSNDDYHSAPGWSCSHIKTFADGPGAYYDKHIKPPEPLDPEADPPDLADQWKDDKELIMGSAIHMAIHEPDLVSSEIIVMPALNLRTNAGRAERDAILMENYPKRLVLTRDMHLMTMRCRDAVWSHPVAAKLLNGSKHERSTFARDPATGELVKCRTDAENETYSVVIDTKSTKDASPAGFAREQVNHHYEFQPPWYLDVLAAARGRTFMPRHWAWIAVQKALRPRVEVFFTPPEEVEQDRKTVRHHFENLLRMRDSGRWRLSDTEDQALPLVKPSWYRRPV